MRIAGILLVALVATTGLSGCFVIRHVADPQNHILESNENDNVSVRVVRLPYRPGRQGCPRYTP